MFAFNVASVGILVKLELGSRLEWRIEKCKV